MARTYGRARERMNPTIDSRTLDKLDKLMAQAGRVLDARVMGKALKEAAEPVLTATRREAPVGRYKDVGGEFVSLRATTKRNDYRRGGATRNDLRIKSVAGVGEEIARTLVGVSKKSGKVGWRTHFITRPTKHKPTANDFLGRGYRQGYPVMIKQLGDKAQAEVNRVLSKLR